MTQARSGPSYYHRGDFEPERSPWRWRLVVLGVFAATFTHLGAAMVGAELRQDYLEAQAKALAGRPKPANAEVGPRLQLSCSLRDRAEYAEACKRRHEAARITQNTK